MKQTTINRMAAWALAALYVGGIAAFSASAQSNATPNGQYEEISSFATGGKFYLDKGSFVPVGNGKIRYQIVGQSNLPGSVNDSGNRVSSNEVDCNTGRLQSPIESWTQDAKGNISSRIPGPQGPITVSSRTKLHGLLKDACSENAPEAKGAW
jgi:hypothetical protein